MRLPLLLSTASASALLRAHSRGAPKVTPQADRSRMACIGGLLLALTTLPLQAQSYLDEVLARPVYRKSWQAMLRDERKLDPWVAGYATARNGTTSPASTVQLGKADYELYGVCEAHNCEGNRLYVLFSMDGRRAWAYHLKNDRRERYFGRPDAAQKAVLQAAARG